MDNQDLKLDREALNASWNLLWDLSGQIFDREGQVNGTVCRLTSTYPQCESPSRADLAESAVLLCQIIKQAIAVTEALSARLNDS